MKRMLTQEEIDFISSIMPLIGVSGNKIEIGNDLEVDGDIIVNSIENFKDTDGNIINFGFKNIVIAIQPDDTTPLSDIFSATGYADLVCLKTTGYQQYNYILKVGRGANDSWLIHGFKITNSSTSFTKASLSSSATFTDLNNAFQNIVNVNGTNDGTNWQTITIDGTTKNIPAGGAVYRHNITITITRTSQLYYLYILSSSSSPIQSFANNELVNKIAYGIGVDSSVLFIVRNNPSTIIGVKLTMSSNTPSSDSFNEPFTFTDTVTQI